MEGAQKEVAQEGPSKTLIKFAPDIPNFYVLAPVPHKHIVAQLIDMDPERDMFFFKFLTRMKGEYFHFATDDKAWYSSKQVKRHIYTTEVGNTCEGELYFKFNKDGLRKFANIM